MCCCYLKILIDLDVIDSSAWLRCKVVFQHLMLSAIKLTVTGQIFIVSVDIFCGVNIQSEIVYDLICVTKWHSGNTDNQVYRS